jgi:hypothetical protein
MGFVATDETLITCTYVLCMRRLIIAEQKRKEKKRRKQIEKCGVRLAALSDRRRKVAQLFIVLYSRKTKGNRIPFSNA